MSQAVKDLLGNSFVDKSGATFDASKLAGKVIGIYFSAHWCPPCRGFTPQLAKTYEAITKAGKNFEVVFASSDKDEEAFKEYLGEMPWIAIPFADRAKKAELSKKFKVQGIPTLVIVDENGEVINARGREAVGGDLSGNNFPWKAKTLLETLPPFVVNHNGEHVSLETLKKAELLGFYFSAHWCPPCRGFTPVLSECYKKLKAKGKNVEIVFVSSDRDEKSFKEYFETMPFLALPFDNAEANSQLSDAFEVEGIPQLTFINPATGKVVIADGRSAISEDPEGNEYPWPEKPMRGLQSGTALFNDKACLLVLADKLAADQAEEARNALTTVSAQFFEGRFKNVDDKPLAFIFGSDKDAELAERVRGFLKLDEKATHVIMDIPNGQKFVGTGGLSAADLHKFADDFLAGSLAPKGLKE